MGKFFKSLSNEFLKQKRTFLFSVVLGTPIIMNILNFLNMFLRFDYYKSKEYYQGLNSWEIMVEANHFLWIFLLNLAIVVICTFIFSVESDNGGWRHALTLPVTKPVVYISKWGAAIILSFIVIALNILLSIIVGKLNGFSDTIDKVFFTNYIYYQFIAALGLVSLQCFISSVCKNIIFPLTIGVIGTAASYFFAQSEVISRLIPYAYEIFTLSIEKANIDNSVALFGGTVFGIVWLLIGIWKFRRKETLT